MDIAPGDQSIKHDIETATNDCELALPIAHERRLSRDIGVQAFSLEIEEEKRKSIDIRCEADQSTDTKRKEYRKSTDSQRHFPLAIVFPFAHHHSTVNASSVEF